jgi:predicted RNA-binding Zn-ribbon protein involved in translation (DUF1610 family)
MKEILKRNQDQQHDFTCPHCGGHEILEYLVNYENIFIYENGELEEGAEGWWEADKVEFLCGNCHEPITDQAGNLIRVHEDLLRYLSGEPIESFFHDLNEDRAVSWSPMVDCQIEKLEPGMLRFVCPQCGGRVLDAVNATITNLYFDKRGLMEFGNVRHVPGEGRFRCHACRWILRDAESGQEMDFDSVVAWLKSNCEQ